MARYRQFLCLGQSTRSAYELGPSLSIEGGASGFSIGEYVLVRVPAGVQVGGYVENEATAPSPQHFGFIRQASLLSDNS